MSIPSELVLTTVKRWQELIPTTGQPTGEIESVCQTDGAGAVVLDMSAVDRLDGAGVALLVQWAARLNQERSRLRLTNLSQRQRALVTLCGVDELLLESVTGG